MKKLFLLDAPALAYRSYFAFSQSDLKTSQGLPTGAIYGFATVLLKIFEQEAPTHFAAAWDAPGPTFRHQRYAAYKAHRPPMPEALSQQLPWMQKLLECLEIPLFQVEGFEADDIIATVVQAARRRNILTYIVSGDKDLAQLVDEGVFLYILQRDSQAKILDVRGVEEKFGVRPTQIVDYLAMVGDSSDNIPGVKGIGPKTARNLLDKWGSLEAIFQNLTKLSNSRVRKLLQSQKESALLSQKLVKLTPEVPLELNWGQMEFRARRLQNLRPLFQRLEFRSLQQKLPESGVGKSKSTASSPASFRFDHPRGVREALELLRSLASAPAIALRTHSSAQPAMWAEFYGIYLSPGEERAIYLDINLCRHSQVQKHLEAVLTQSQPKLGFDLKRDILLLRRNEISLSPPLVDLHIAHHLLHPDSVVQGFWELFRDRVSAPSVSSAPPQQSTFWPEDDSQNSVVHNDLSQQVVQLHVLSKQLLSELEQHSLQELFLDLEMPLLSVLAQMEYQGIYLDIPTLEGLQGKLQDELSAISQEIYRLAGEEINIQSTKQLQHILFEKLKLPEKLGKKIPKTKTGRSTNQAVLHSLSEHPLPARILEYRQLSKLLSTYVQPLPSLVHPYTKRIHTTFQQAITATGRLSSTDPNLQNIPIRSEWGKQIRKAFLPQDPDWIFLSADYSQIELRVLAHFSQDPTLLHAFENDLDIHQATAAKILGVPLYQVSPLWRRRAKAINFGILYGMGAQKLAASTDMSLGEAKEFIQNYFQLYPKVKEFIDHQIEVATRSKKVITLLGRQRFLPNLTSTHSRLQAEAKRLAVNTPIQGSAADIIKLAMLKLHRALVEENLRARLLLQVHDELLLELPEDEREKVEKIVKNIMENCIQLRVPLKVNLGSGKNWLEAHA
ncbi:MAG: DNA polymerase I [Planctomycetota bacterium]|nr:MAG: DNA polymerase I [Planctomycetota bacterium]